MNLDYERVPDAHLVKYAVDVPTLKNPLSVGIDPTTLDGMAEAEAADHVERVIREAVERQLYEPDVPPVPESGRVTVDPHGRSPQP